MLPTTLDGGPLPVEGRVYIAGPGMRDLACGSLSWLAGRRVIVRRVEQIDDAKGTRPAQIVELLEVRVFVRGHKVERFPLGVWDGVLADGAE